MSNITNQTLSELIKNIKTKKLSSFENQMNSETFESDFGKKERLTISREKAKLEKVLGGISSLTRIPAAIFIVDIKFEEIALSEAKKLNLPIYGLVDTNSDPNLVDFPIPANDDSLRTIQLLMGSIADAILDIKRSTKDSKEPEKVIFDDKSNDLENSQLDEEE